MPDISPLNGSNRPLELIEAQTDGATSEVFTVPDGKTATIFSDPLGAGETVGVELMRPDGNFVSIASALMNNANNQSGVYSKGIYRVVKSGTGSAVGVYIYGGTFYQAGRK